MKVLFCEDNALVAMAVESVLLTHGHVVLGPFATPDEGLDALEHERPDVALLDFMLRKDNSIRVAEAALGRSIPVIFMTGYAQLPELPFARERVVQLSKPVSEQDLIEALERHATLKPSPVPKI